MNLIGIGNNIINLDQVTHIWVEEGGVTFFFANLMPVGAFSGSQQPDKVDQIKLLGDEADLVKKLLGNAKYVNKLDKGSQASKAMKQPEKWETDNDFPVEGNKQSAR